MSQPDRVLPNVVSTIIITTLVASFFMAEKAYVGGMVVAIPTLIYVQYSRWVAQRTAARVER
ncbi:hypothetical protein [Aeromicrobium sp. 9AM]|uniref:hypothetical protein n=1 Tax=Aeromicrobium sp. 9AM TaxID=2653126 RepID=UPI0012F46B73|nr:hypothetical protein [Aeromicrobium sp. 9AM]VXB75974.1 hypothetical protein AERO9AM_20836 [Aeromicrobium sp. 9AM]